MMQGMMESSAWRATLTALRAFVATAEPRYSYHRHPEATAILLDSGGNKKSPRLSELQ